MPTHEHHSLQLCGSFLRQLLAVQRRRAVWSIVLNILLGATNGIGILLLIPMLELLSTNEPVSSGGVSKYITQVLSFCGLRTTLETMLLTFVIVYGSHALLSRCLTVLNSRLQLGFTENLRCRLFEAISHADWHFLARTRRSDFVHSLTSDLDRVANGTVYLLRLASATALAAVHLTLSLLLSPYLTLATLGVAALLWPLLTRQNRASRETGQHVTDLMRRMYANVTEHLAGLKETKSLGTVAQQTDGFRRLAARVRQAHLGYVRTSANTSLIYTWGAGVVLSGLIYLAIVVLQTPFVELSVLVLLFARLMPKLREIHSNYQGVLHMLPAFASAMAHQTACEQAHEQLGSQETTPLRPRDLITLENVGFCYEEPCLAWALRDVDLCIPANRTTAIVGPSGAGKSTLADLIMGLLQPREGTITVDGVPLTGDPLFAWRQAVGYVPQEPFLMHDTVCANLLWARPRATDAELDESLRLAAAEDFVYAMPNGLDTMIGDRGHRLSGGERQRIALARALLRQPAVLILDEATSALDSENERRIHAALEQFRGKITIIIIAHRLSTVRDADSIVVIDAGRLVEFGSYQQLVGRSESRFYQLLEAAGMHDTTQPHHEAPALAAGEGHTVQTLAPPSPDRTAQPWRATMVG